MKKALIAMSGGVDSATAAYLTLAAGYDVIGCIMQLHGQTASNDIDDAAAIARRLGIPFHVFDFRDEFRSMVMEPFAARYLAGQTPNPCISCNRYLKFGSLMQAAEQLGCDTLVTGHYARIIEENGIWSLKKAADHSKDQSYVLYTIPQHALPHILFPLGTLTKSEARAIAEEQGFVNAHKKDSQDICFVPDGDYAPIVQQLTHVTPTRGDFVDLQGNLLGQHAGILHYTIGQRRGLGIAIGKPAYVCGFDVPRNRVIIGDNADLFTATCTIDDVNLLRDLPVQQDIPCSAKIRYRHEAQPAMLHLHGDGTATISFASPQRAITAGQAAVCYADDTVIAGGTIRSAI